MFPLPPPPPLPLLPPKNGNALFFIFQCGYFYFEHKNKEEMIFFALHRAPPLFSVFFFFPFIFAFRSLLFSSPFPFFPVSPFPFWLVGWLVVFLLFFFGFLFLCVCAGRCCRCCCCCCCSRSSLAAAPANHITHTHTHAHTPFRWLHTHKKKDVERRKKRAELGRNERDSSGCGLDRKGRGHVGVYPILHLLHFALFAVFDGRCYPTTNRFWNAPACVCE